MISGGIRAVINGTSSPATKSLLAEDGGSEMGWELTDNQFATWGMYWAAGLGFVIAYLVGRQADDKHGAFIFGALCALGIVPFATMPFMFVASFFVTIT